MIFEIICTIFDTIILIIYLQKILGRRREIIPAIVYAGSFCFVETMLFLLMFYFNHDHSSLKAFITILVSLATTFFLTMFHSGNLRHRLFAAISFQIYATISELIVYSIFSLLPASMAESLLSEDSYGLLASKIVLFILLNITILLWNRKKKNYSLQYSILILIMPILSLILLITMSQQTGSETSHYIFQLISMSGILTANVTNYFLLDNVLKVRQLEQQKIQRDKQFEYQSNKYQQISTAYRNSRRLIHDAKKHFFFIQSCMAEQNYETVIPYIQKAVKDIEQTHNRINTGNLVIDAFVSSHQTIAEQENIDFYTDIQINNENVEIADYDFSIILGNLLDNSLNACRKIQVPSPRQIGVEIFTTNMELVIHITNTITSSAVQTSPGSTDLFHGYGIKNIEKIVAQYMGTYTYYTESQKYHAIISVPCHIS